MTDPQREVNVARLGEVIALLVVRVKESVVYKAIFVEAVEEGRGPLLRQAYGTAEVVPLSKTFPQG
jgi:hypothetical protein